MTAGRSICFLLMWELEWWVATRRDLYIAQLYARNVARQAVQGEYAQPAPAVPPSSSQRTTTGGRSPRCIE